MLMECPTCNRTGPDLGQCGATLTCPMVQGQEPSPVDTDKDAVLHCEPCGFTRAVSVAHLIKAHNPPRLDHSCPRGEELCQCIVVHPTAMPVAHASKGK